MLTNEIGTELQYVEFYVGDAESTVAELVATYGFEIVGRTPDVAAGHHSVVVRQRDITLIVTDARSAQHPAAARVQAHVAAHGDAVAAIWLRCQDVRTVFEAAVAAGAHVLREPGTDPRAGCATAEIRAFGDVRHVLVEWAGDARAWRLPPGVEPVPATTAGSPGTGPATTGINELDHFAVCVPAGELETTVRFYEAALGFRRIFAEQIVVGRQMMISEVVQNACGDVTLTIIEPDPAHDPGQIDAFLRDHGGAGVQHIAFSCGDIVRTAHSLRNSGVQFLSTPDSYYDRLAERMTPVKYDVAQLREIGLLADSDHAGQLFQIFTRSTHPRNTFFWELIERQGATTFGSGNIKALYEAVERDLTVPAGGAEGIGAG